MAIRLWLRSLILVLVSAFCLSGCGGPPFAKVEGHVTFQGQPLRYVQVIFYPDAGGPRSVGFTDENGHYQLNTEAIQRISSREGVIIGMHHVCLKDMQAFLKRRPARNEAQGSKSFRSRAAEMAKTEPIRKADRFPAAYTKLDATPWREVEVKPGEQMIDLEVK
jgi:hypothetical protein